VPFSSQKARMTASTSIEFVAACSSANTCELVDDGGTHVGLQLMRLLMVLGERAE